MRVSKAISQTKPENKVERISTNNFACRVCDGIIESDNGFEFTSYRDSFLASSYSQLLIKIIHARYSYDDENNFINDYLAEGATKKYQVYRNFVDWAKSVAKLYFQKEE